VFLICEYHWIQSSQPQGRLNSGLDWRKCNINPLKYLDRLLPIARINISLYLLTNSGRRNELFRDNPCGSDAPAPDNL